MNIHKNARLPPLGRDWLVRQMESGQPPEIAARSVGVCSNLPTSWSFATAPEDFTGRMFSASNGMILDVLAAVARKDYEDRCRRQSEGHAKARAAGVHKGRPEDAARNVGIARMLGADASWSEIQAAFKCSRSTVARVNCECPPRPNRRS